jgi:hypothetical protein
MQSQASSSLGIGNELIATLVVIVAVLVANLVISAILRGRMRVSREIKLRASVFWRNSSLLAAALALLGTALAYLVIGVVLGVAASWSQKTALDQAVGLAGHAAVVFVRGVLPAVVATGLACIAWRRWRGSDPGVLATLASALPLAVLVTVLLLTSPTPGWPYLSVKGAADAIATVSLLGAAGAAADLLARRWLRRLREPSAGLAA